MTTSDEPEQPDEGLPDVDDVSEAPGREMVFGAYREGDLSDDQREAFEARLEEDASFREAFDDYESFVDDIQSLPAREAPEDFESNLRGRVRRRSGGRLFAREPAEFTSARRRHELAAVAMLAVMTSAYLLMGLPSDRGLESVDDTRLEVPSVPTSQTVETTGGEGASGESR